MTQNLRAKALKGASFTVAGRLMRAVQGVAVLGILSRYLTATEFGLIAMVAFVTSIAQVFTDFGTRVALVQKQDATRLEEDSVFWWNLGVGSLLTIGVMLASPWIAEMMGSDEVVTPLLWVAPIFVMGALQGVPQSVLERRLAFGQLTTAEVSAALGSSLVAVIMVLLGFKLGALIAQMMAGPIVNLIVILWFARWRPRLQFSYPVLRPLLSYGGYVTAAGVVQIISGQMDRPVVGNRLSATDLGYSRLAEQIVFSPLRITVQMVRKVMFPIMATIQDDDVRMRRGYLTMQHGLMVVMAPIAFGLWAVAHPAVRVLLGPGWDMVAVLMGLTTIRSMFNTFNDLNSVIFSAKGWAKFQFRWAIFSGTMSVCTLLLTVNYGIVAVVAGRLAVTALLTPLNSYFALRLISQPPLQVANVLLRPILSAALMGMAVAWVQAQLTVPAMMQLVICMPLGVVLYVLLQMLVDRQRFGALVRQILARRKRA
jgi:O-antigen/teichoic acid export membrane protein